ncbi:MAG: type II toxin-antitoxin system VapC family toxin [Candidatus Yonathbacteria bacterium]|nr:type II toxin-antitoxin system VapC family toxin [Candidatus Yonathbacteria bacterium]
MYLFDINAIIYFLSGDKKSVDLVTEIVKDNKTIYVPTIVRLELFSKPDLTSVEQNAISDFLSHTIEINLDKTIADIVATIRRNFKIKVADSIVAASAFYTNSFLVTRDTKDFKIPDIRVLKI